MAYTNPVSALGIATAQTGGLNIVTAPTTGTFTAPSPGQLIVANVRVTALTVTTVAPTVLALNASAVTVNTLTAIGTPVNIGSGGAYWTQLYYAIAVGTERSLTCTWGSATAPSTGAGEAVCIYGEIDGFIGTPTLNPNSPATGSTPTNNTSLTSSSLTIQSISDLMVGSIGFSNTATIENFTFDSSNSMGYINGNSYLLLPYGVPPQGTTSATTIASWTTNRAGGLIVASFYDPGATDAAIVHHPFSSSNIAVMRAANY